MYTIGTALLLFRPALLFIGALAQVYLFIQVRRALQASARSERFRSRATWCVGAAIGFLWVLHVYVVLARLPWVEPPFIAQVGLLYPAVVWNYGSILSALLLLGLRAGGRLGHLFSRVRSPSARAAPPASVDVSRRRFLQAGAGGLAAVPFVLVGYGAGYAARAYRVTELSLPFGRSLRVVHLSDIHAGLYMTRDEMKDYADLVNSLQPDLFVLTGDFISNSMYFLYGCAEEMARVRSRYGTFAVLGNHEHWYGNPREVEAVFRAQQISLLNNAHRVIQTDQGPFAVAGIDDLGSGRPELGAALQGLNPSIPTLLLSHHPEIFPQAARHGVPLTLAGHWHGGQIRVSLPGIEVSVAHLLSPYPEGLYRINASHLYVTRGIGTAWTPIRLNASPEVVLLTLK
jgi:predicted MPP superfamily phosphohydrolase